LCISSQTISPAVAREDVQKMLMTLTVRARTAMFASQHYLSVTDSVTYQRTNSLICHACLDIKSCKAHLEINNVSTSWGSLLLRPQTFVCLSKPLRLSRFSGDWLWSTVSQMQFQRLTRTPRHISSNI